MAAQNHGSDDRAYVRFEQIRPHPRSVSRVVSHVVGNRGRVKRVILRNSGFHFAHQVSAYVGGFGVNAPPTRAKSAMDDAPKEKPVRTERVVDKPLCPSNAPKFWPKNRNKPPNPRIPSPTTPNPMTDPPAKAISSALPKLSCAAWPYGHWPWWQLSCQGIRPRPSIWRQPQRPPQSSHCCRVVCRATPIKEGGDPYYEPK